MTISSIEDHRMSILTAIGAWFVKEIWSKLTFKHLAYLVAALALAYCQYQFYQWSHTRGATAQAAADAKQIAQITGERNDWQTRYKAYKRAHFTWVHRSEQARLLHAKLNAENVAALEQRLAAAEVQATKTKGRTHAIPKFVPPPVDFVLPAGFVRLFNLSLEGEPGSGATVADPVSESLAFDAQAPSGTSLSAFSVVSTENNAECVARGEVIRTWQKWYEVESANFTEAQRASAAAIPQVEVDLPPSQPPTP